MEWILKKELKEKQKVETFEKLYKIGFPQEFKELIEQHHAARPEPYLIDAENTKEIPAKSLLSFNESDKPEDIWSSYQAVKERLPVNVIPFMSDEGGNYFCFDLDPLENEAPIVYWSHENSKVEYVADNLEQFIKRFYGF
ncbi:SMI1/KNR4 family protein [Domibacillus robiginosus]|uniref:SMI1/KNR4 family protein n=1 Tax=Domibacillus robiginosus TaxID=1071054 RepID=UPI00067E5401|nr:SMI1/KNR4 family protein [Domibacillus robiginosus]